MGIYGGILYIVYWYVKVNNKYMWDCNIEIEIFYIIYLDVNNFLWMGYDLSFINRSF